MKDQSNQTEHKSPADAAAWKDIVSQYQKPSTWRALWPILNTLGPYSAIWYLMYLSLAVSWWLAVPLAVLAGAFFVRTFIICHHCGQRSFFKTPTADNTLGFITLELNFKADHHWRPEYGL